MRISTEIRKILNDYKNTQILEMVIPKEYQDLKTSYCRNHNEPNEQKQTKDYEFLKRVLNLK